MTEIILCAINQVRKCHITPEELEISQTKFILYTKLFPKDLKVTKCRIQHQREKWHCEHDDQRRIAHTIAGITSDLMILPKQCRSIAKGKIIYLADLFWKLITIQRILSLSQTVPRVGLTEMIATDAV